jgi:hypothetical protein
VLLYSLDLMKSAPDTDLTVVLMGKDGVFWFKRDAGTLVFANGEEKTFEELMPRYGKYCAPLLNMFLNDEDHFVFAEGHLVDKSNRQRWNNDTDLKYVIGALRKLFQELGYNGPDLFPTSRGRGYYELLKSSVRDPGLPQLRWVEELAALVREGKSAQVRILPGNGASRVPKLLGQVLRQACIVPIDLTLLSQADELLGSIADIAEAQVSPVTRDGRPDYINLARTVAGPSNLLALIVEGWGAFAQRHDKESLEKVAGMLHGLMKVTVPFRPLKVAVVLVAPIPLYHFLPPHVAGSLLTLQPILPSATDSEELEEWARQRLRNIPEDEVKELLEAAGGQLAATQAAVNAAQRNHSERLQAVYHAHVNAGQSLLGAVGPCCRDVLLGMSQKPGCSKVLKEAGILEERDKGIHLRVQGWATSWVGEG